MRHKNNLIEIDPKDIGFIRSEDDDHSLSFSNTNMFRNEVSPFCLTKSRFRFTGRGVVIDPQFGNIYEAGVELPSGLYGNTRELPPYAGERPDQNNFLRVPFRRIPRLPMRNRVEFNTFINQISSADDSLAVLFRGQNKEYLLNRGAVAGELLYGDPNACEPSLLASATRHSIQLEDIGAEWSALVQIFIANWVEKMRQDGISTSTSTKISEHMEAMVSGFGLWAFLISMAQHYGLPSAGLDVTDRPEVALFFALTKIAPRDPGSHIMRTIRAPTTSDRPVIYILVPNKDDALEFSKYRPFGFPLGRPDRQNAFFLHTSWGCARNRIADRIWIALDLDPEGDWGPLPSAHELFPGHQDDPFSAFLEQARTLPCSELFHRFLSHFYVVE